MTPARGHSRSGATSRPPPDGPTDQLGTQSVERRPVGLAARADHDILGPETRLHVAPEDFPDPAP